MRSLSQESKCEPKSHQGMHISGHARQRVYGSLAPQFPDISKYLFKHLKQVSHLNMKLLSFHKLWTITYMGTLSKHHMESPLAQKLSTQSGPINNQTANLVHSFPFQTRVSLFLWWHVFRCKSVCLSCLCPPRCWFHPLCEQDWMVWWMQHWNPSSK